ncbi:MAG TPA: molecular chaperone DnaK, partial [Candidatus Paceibacterota bacterium]|nr:molecular chaperone DnaK [Candidatus Paceibacterota bacterium]
AGEDTDAIKAATEALSASLSKIGEAMMKQQGEQQTGAPSEEGQGEKPPQEGATDAEFKEKEGE